uniref:Macaca fascicularis brain cDNA clone: QflA-16515, similar to human forkhead box J2 (FOXJ2), mRNA, RefSeq: NM_018416.2 n=1 Tax=Macaca fascicularis TaxID=9541 RepID=I7GBE4_MACFA|nr:unnamed protein product [Macaca fascicularis]
MRGKNNFISVLISLAEKLWDKMYGIDKATFFVISAFHSYYFIYP